MTTTQDLSILAMIANASIVVQLVMLLLLVVSFMSWYFIFLKLFTIHRAQSRTEQFERDFWSGSDLPALFQSAVNHRHSTGSLERIFEAGYREFSKLKSQRGVADPSLMVDGARRAMRATYQREMDRLEASLSFLASVGSVSPYVGLLGTVWGIMRAFHDMAHTGSAGPSVVAAGVAEALFTTAAGLMVAVPAVMLYNHFLRRMGVMLTEAENHTRRLRQALEENPGSKAKAA